MIGHFGLIYNKGYVRRRIEVYVRMTIPNLFRIQLVVTSVSASVFQTLSASVSIIAGRTFHLCEPVLRDAVHCTPHIVTQHFVDQSFTLLISSQ